MTTKLGDARPEGSDRAKVLLVWCKVLSVTAEPAEYAERITTLISCSYGPGREEVLNTARQMALPPQREALAKAIGA